MSCNCRELLECGHPKACWYEAHHFVAGGKDNQTCARCGDDIHLHIPKSDAYCSGCKEREKVREMCAEYLEKQAAKCADFADKEAGETRAAWNRGENWYEDAADAIRQLDLTAPSKETRRAEMFCNQCQGYVNVLAAPDHLKTHPEHTMRLRWYPPVDEGGEEKGNG